MMKAIFGGLWVWWIFGILSVVHGWQASDYWNARYGTETGFILYEPEVNDHGMWSDDLGRTAGYGMPTTRVTGTHCGCATCTGYVISTTCNDVLIKGVPDLPYINDTFFPSPAQVEKVHIYNIDNFDRVHENTFLLAKNLEELIIQYTLLNNIPIINSTAVTALNLAHNAIELTPGEYKKQTLPTQLKYVNFANNKLRWIPDGMFAGSNVEILSLSENMFRYVPIEGLSSMAHLIYLGLDGNRIEAVSHESIIGLQDSPLQHLNMSNNNIYYLPPDSFKFLNNLRILELHNNRLAKVEPGVFRNIPELLHLDLNQNEFFVLTSKLFVDLPNLIELRLHSQKSDGLQIIMFDVFKGINQKLKYLWISDNALQTFPHQIFVLEQYDALEIIWADHNQISQVTTFSETAYPVPMRLTYLQHNDSYTPFSGHPNLEILYLGHNTIEIIDENDFCGIPRLIELHMENNLLTEETIPDVTFKCTPQLQVLNLASNDIQYVPEAVQYKEYLPNIEELDLNSNHLTYLVEGAFTELDTLLSLYLQGNGIIAIENGTFPKNSLSTINLAENKFRFLHENPFTGMENLTSLDLSKNNIVILPESAFHGTPLRSLNLAHNQLKKLTKVHFQDCDFENYFDVSYNDLAFIEDGTFKHMPSMHTVDLGYNKLTSVPNDGDFQNKKFSRLSINGNRLIKIPAHAFENSSAITMNLANNKILTIETEAFYGIDTTSLILNGNPLKNLQSYAFSSCSLGVLSLEDNGITELRENTFADVEASSILLSGNSIVSIEKNAFNGVTVPGVLDLSDNQISSIEPSLFGVGSSTGTLKLSQNQLSSLEKGVFNGATIEKLYIEHNDFIVFPKAALADVTPMNLLSLAYNSLFELSADAFSSSHSQMETLELQGNSITAIGKDIFKPLVSLRNLILSDNKIRTIQSGAFQKQGLTLETLDLSNNKLEYLSPLSPMSQLSTLNLVNNDLTAIAPAAFDNALALGSSKLFIGNNPLGCECTLYSTMRTVRTAIQSGECSLASLVASHSFALSQEDTLGYFLNSNQSDFLCTASSVLATAQEVYEIKVTWVAPDTLFPGNLQIGGLNPQPGKSGDWTYDIKCSSAHASTLTYTYVDESGGLTQSFSHTFLQADGVQAGTEYTCHVTLKAEDSNIPSTASAPAYVTTLSVVGTPLIGGPDDFVVDGRIFDFSITHPDFSGTSLNYYSNPNYEKSPYGSWLSITDQPVTSTFTDFFRYKVGKNYAFNQQFLLENQIGRPVQTNRVFKNPYYPIDTLGYGTESQEDCDFKARNAGFTTVIDAGLIYEGHGTVTVAGGDELWLSINGTVVLQVLSDPSSPNIKCRRLDLTSAAGEAGGWMVPSEGQLDTTSGACASLTSMPDDKVWLQLDTGNTYHMELFHVERKPCKSLLFLETTELKFYKANNGGEPATDYFLDIQEDLHINGILVEISLRDAFSSPPPYNVTISQGNEARHFTIKDDTQSNRDLASPPTANAYNFTTLPGIDTPFVVCNGSSELVPEPIIVGSEEFVITTNQALLTLKTNLDREVKDVYVLVLTVVDDSLPTPQTGTVVVKVNVIDVNDNCPILDDVNTQIQTMPALQEAPIIYFTATDRDVGQNGNITYHSAAPYTDPPLSRYSPLDDLYRQVYNETSELVFTLLAIDHGTNPPRGATTEARIRFSNTCLLTVLYEEIDVRIDVDQFTGDVYLRVPGYYVYDFPCNRVAGMEKGYIIDAQITASSYLPEAPPHRARLHGTDDPYRGEFGAWIPAVKDFNQWLQVDMQEPYKFTQILVSHDMLK